MPNGSWFDQRRIFRSHDLRGIGVVGAADLWSTRVTIMEIAATRILETKRRNEDRSDVITGLRQLIRMLQASCELNWLDGEDLNLQPTD